MDDVPELYAEPHNPALPVFCFDEAGKELHGEVAEPLPTRPGSMAERDYDYTWHGTVNLFLAVEPLAGRRHVGVIDRRTIPDFAARMKHLCDEMYPEAEAIPVVLDNLNTHRIGSRFATYAMEEAWRLEFHFTPKHAGWLNMAECELSVLARQCLDRRLASRGRLGGGEAVGIEEECGRGGDRAAYSIDLRERLLIDHDEGMPTKYCVSGSRVRRLEQHRRETGSIAPKDQRHDPLPRR